ncbi:13244_t:CDS:2, partial [Racocetra persica]
DWKKISREGFGTVYSAFLRDVEIIAIKSLDYFGISKSLENNSKSIS